MTREQVWDFIGLGGILGGFLIFIALLLGTAPNTSAQPVQPRPFTIYQTDVACVYVAGSVNPSIAVIAKPVNEDCK